MFLDVYILQGSVVTINVLCMLPSSKFFTEFTGEKNVKIDQYLATIWTKCNSLLFWPTLYIIYVHVSHINNTTEIAQISTVQHIA